MSSCNCVLCTLDVPFKNCWWGGHIFFEEDGTKVSTLDALRAQCHVPHLLANHRIMLKMKIFTNLIGKKWDLSILACNSEY